MKNMKENHFTVIYVGSVQSSILCDLNDGDYSFRVHGVNSVGKGPFSDESIIYIEGNLFFYIYFFYFFLFFFIIFYYFFIILFFLLLFLFLLIFIFIYNYFYDFNYFYCFYFY